MLNSLRSRLLVGMTVSISVLLILFGVIIYTTIRRWSLEEFDFALEKMARTMAAAALVERGVIEVELAPELIPDFQQVGGALYFQYWLEDGAILDRSTSLDGADLPNFHGSGEAPALKSIRLPNGRLARRAPVRRLGLALPELDPSGPEQGSGVRSVLRENGRESHLRLD